MTSAADPGVRPSSPRRRASNAGLAVAAVLGCWAASCAGASAGDVVSIGGPTMGTAWSVTLAGLDSPLPAPADREALRAAITADLDRVNVLMSTWDPASELSRFNRSTSIERFPVSPETFEVLQWAARLSVETDGAFDVTVGPLVDAWGFGADESSGTAPDAGTVTALVAATGMRHLDLDPDGRWIRKHHAGVRCDVSAIVPGYAADRIAALLSSRGFEHFLVDVGGELVARGRNGDGVPWRVAVERPGNLPGASVERVVSLGDMAIATSGDYRNYREVGGERVAHIIDPRTGYPVRHGVASATVVDALAVRADALATALMVLGPEEGLALAEKLELAALLIVRRPDGGFDTRASSAFPVEGAP